MNDLRLSLRSLLYLVADCVFMNILVSVAPESSAVTQCILRLMSLFDWVIKEGSNHCVLPRTPCYREAVLRPVLLADVPHAFSISLQIDQSKSITQPPLHG